MRELLSIETIRKCVLQRNIIMITAYYPDYDEWEEDMKTRRKE